MKLLLGTSNTGKIVEVREAVGALPLEIVAPADIGISISPHEEGDTFRANALQKAHFYFQNGGGLPTLADDSGIEVEALIDELGIHTRRWGAGKEASDHRWIEFFLDRMRSERNKCARFLCTLCFIDAQGREHFFEGECRGSITDELEADFLPGLPISACFKPDGYDRVYSALGIEEKNRISHRGKALQLFSEYISQEPSFKRVA